MITIGRDNIARQTFEVSSAVIKVVITEVDPRENTFHSLWNVFMNKTGFFQSQRNKRIWFSSDDKILQLALDIYNDLIENKIPSRIYKVKTKEVKQ